MKKIFVFGSTNIDLVSIVDTMPRPGETIYGKEFFINVGGKGANQAASAAALGAQVFLITSIGQDQYRNLIISELTRVKTNLEYIHESKIQTGIAHIVVSKEDNQIIIHPYANHDDFLFQLKHALDCESNQGDILIVQLELNQKLVFEAVQLAKTYGLIVVMNPTPMQDLVYPFYQYVDILVLNQIETKDILKADLESVESSLKMLKNLGYKQPIITLGKQGSATIIDHDVYYAKSYRVDVVDTTGAGDTYIGALTAEFARQNTIAIAEAMQFASAASALAVTKKGALKSVPTRTEVLSFMEQNNENKFK